MATARPFVHGGSRLFQFDRNGKFTREIGQGVYGFLFGAQVRVDPQDNLWVVDEYSSMAMKFDPQGRVVSCSDGSRSRFRILAALGEHAGAAALREPARRRTPSTGRPTSGGTHKATSSCGRPRQRPRRQVFERRRVRQVMGQRGNATGQFATVDSVAVDAQGNVYAADGGNQRVQVFDNNGTFKAEIRNVGNAQAICITPGANQVMYVSSNSNPPNDLDTAGEIYKMRLDGTIVGRFGRAGKLLKEFGTVSAIDCRTENVLYVGEAPRALR
jgi:hypothetical protein